MWKKSLYLFGSLAIICLLAAFFVGGCDTTSKPTESQTTQNVSGPAEKMFYVGDEATAFLRQHGSITDSSAEIPTKNLLQQIATAYPPACFVLNVPWIKQFPPGDQSNTKNCGQACGVMIGGFFNNGTVASWVITSENSWLAAILHDSRYLDPNGWYTNFTGTNALGKLLNQYHAVRYSVMCAASVEVLINQVYNSRRPVLVGVMISGGRLVRTGGVAHWALVVGWDGCNVILNDPGTKDGNFIRYSVSTFNASWATQSCVMALLYK